MCQSKRCPAMMLNPLPSRMCIGFFAMRRCLPVCQPAGISALSTLLPIVANPRWLATISLTLASCGVLTHGNILVANATSRQSLQLVLNLIRRREPIIVEGLALGSVRSPEPPSRRRGCLRAENYPERQDIVWDEARHPESSNLKAFKNDKPTKFRSICAGIRLSRDKGVLTIETGELANKPTAASSSDMAMRTLLSPPPPEQPRSGVDFFP